MKVQIDENLPPALARALNAIASTDNYEVIHVTDYAKGDPDPILFRKAIDAGVAVHITQDHHHRRTLEKEAIAGLGLTVFVLASSWNNIENYQKAAWLIEWFPKIMQMAKLTTSGSIYIVPACNARRGRLKPFQKKR